MRIIKTHFRKSIEQKSRNKELIPNVMERLFMICREHTDDKTKDNIDDVVKRIKELSNTLDTQKKLLKKAETTRDELANKVEGLENLNISKRSQLLEDLGSEL